jgi:hypothetical protein
LSGRVILLAAGEMKRWQNYLNVPKHLVEIEGEPLLHRLIRQCHDSGVTDIRVATLHEGALPGPAVLINVDTALKDHYAGKFLSTQASWAEEDRTFLIFGDTWLSTTGFKAIMTPVADGICFVGRRGAGSYTGCPYGEIFGVSFAPSHHRRIAAAAQKIGSDKQAHRLAAGWALYHYLSSVLAADKSTDIIFVDIDDFSEDFDFPHDYDIWQEKARALPYIATPESQNPVTLRRKQRRKHRVRRNNFLIISALILFGFVIGQRMRIPDHPPTYSDNMRPPIPGYPPQNASTGS